MGWPADGKVSIKAMRPGGAYLRKSVSRVELAGKGQALAFRQSGDGLHVTLAGPAPALPYAFALKIV